TEAGGRIMQLKKGDQIKIKNISANAYFQKWLVVEGIVVAITMFEDGSFDIWELPEISRFVSVS
ncbi:MAG: hypothetical protein KAJ10_05340, partial [Thermodesulfovibrionia bacterium]|nr:hypothetical protein [Thermodesulfovibrionia bacterium]